MVEANIVPAADNFTNIFVKDVFETVSVSSVLQKKHRENGKKHLYDDKPETCWNSDQGLPQHIVVKYGEQKTIDKFSILSQGGFCPRQINLYFDDVLFDSYEGEDINIEQSFTLKEKSPPFNNVKLEFTASTDFYGRVTIYELKLL